MTLAAEPAITAHILDEVIFMRYDYIQFRRQVERMELPALVQVVSWVLLVMVLLAAALWLLVNSPGHRPHQEVRRVSEPVGFPPKEYLE